MGPPRLWRLASVVHVPITPNHRQSLANHPQNMTPITCQSPSGDHSSGLRDNRFSPQNYPEGYGDDPASVLAPSGAQGLCRGRSSHARLLLCPFRLQSSARASAPICGSEALAS